MGKETEEKVKIKFLKFHIIYIFDISRFNKENGK